MVVTDAGRDELTAYEGQAAIALQQRAYPDERGGYPVEAGGGAPLLNVGRGLVRCVMDDLLADADPAGSPRVSTTASRMDRMVSGLEGQGFRVLVHSRVPPNDGGISLGQAVVAGAPHPAGA
jgi:hydrogenase maturation protein HypF